MGKYLGLQKILEEIPNDLGFEYYPLNGNNAIYTEVLIRKLSKNFVLDWKIENNLLFSEEITNEVSEKLKTLFFNHLWFPKGTTVNKEYLLNFISDNEKNQTPETRILFVLEYIYKNAPFAGDRINIGFNDLPFAEQYWRGMFFHSLQEFVFYIETAEDLGYIEIQAKTSDGYLGIRLTAQGLKTIISQENEKNSKICFVAMSFDDEMYKLYCEAIRPAIIETGFDPLIISEKKDIPSDSTINDAILAAIKKSKFTIADFTKHKHGVYFESGYALGRGQKVIYTCREDEIGKAHFDTRNYPHIVWKNAEDLKKQLVDKIEVFIKS